MIEVTREELLYVAPSADFDRVFEKLIYQWWNPLFTYAKRLTKNYDRARELHIDTLAKLWENRNKLDHLYHFYQWAKRAMQRFYIDEVRKYWTHKRHILDDYAASPLDMANNGHQEGESSGGSTSEKLQVESDKGRFADELENQIFVTQITSILDDQERGILKAVYYENLTADEAAKALNLTKPAFKSKLYRSIKKMQLVCGVSHV